MLPDDVATRLKHESRRRGVSVAELVREAVERHLPGPKAGEPRSFFALGEGGPPDASERVDEHVHTAMRRYRRA